MKDFYNTLFIIYTLYSIYNIYSIISIVYIKYILLTKVTAAQNGVALSYHKVRGLYFLAVVYGRNMIWPSRDYT